MRLALEASVSEPESCSNVCAAGGFEFEFEAYELDAAQWETGAQTVDTATFRQLGLRVTALALFGLTVVEGQTADVEVLLGAPPERFGSAGVFPLVAGGTLEFVLGEFQAGGLATRFTVTTALLLGDTLAQVVAKINAAALLAGVLVPVASSSGGQVALRGDAPGAVQTLQLTTAFAGAGFPTLGLWQGSGWPVMTDRAFVATLGASPVIAGEDVWVRGGLAQIKYIAAGS